MKVKIRHKTEINIRIPDSLGDTLISTSIVKYLLSEYANTFKLNIWTDYNWAFSAFESAENLEKFSKSTPEPYDIIDLSAYLDLLPHRRKNKKHHTGSMFEVLAAKVNGINEEYLYLPTVFSEKKSDYKEFEKTYSEILQKSGSKKLIWLCPRSTTENRNPKETLFIELASLLIPSFQFIEFLGPREKAINSKHIISVSMKPGAMALLMKECFAGITVDTFGLHLAGAKGLSRVLVLLGSSHPECVCYPGNEYIYKKSNETDQCQPCGNHGYQDVKLIESTFEDPNLHFSGKNRCVFNEIKCIEQIDIVTILFVLEKWVISSNSN